MAPPGDQDRVVPVLVQAAADGASDGARPVDDESHARHTGPPPRRPAAPPPRRPAAPPRRRRYWAATTPARMVSRPRMSRAQAETSSTSPPAGSSTSSHGSNRT